MKICQTGYKREECTKTDGTNLALLLKEISKSKIYKKRNNKHLVAKGENLYIEINKSHDPLGQNLFVPVVVLNGIFMMEDTL